jgi:hypothetical protein
MPKNAFLAFPPSIFWATGSTLLPSLLFLVCICCGGVSPALHCQGAPDIFGHAELLQACLPSIADILHSLTDSLHSGKKGGDQLEWFTSIRQAFAAARKALTDATYLAYPLPGAALSLVVVTLATHVSAGLHQRLQGSSTWEPLGFFSKKLEPAQTKY